MRAQATTEVNGPVVVFTARGLPVGQGSMRTVMAAGRAHIVHNHGKALIDWRLRIGNEAQVAMGVEPMIVGPVRVVADFYLPRPKAHSAPDGALRPWAPVWAPTTPDIDKLERALLDALTGVCFADDKQVVSLWCDKYYSDDGVLGVSVNVAHAHRSME